MLFRDLVAQSLKAGNLEDLCDCLKLVSCNSSPCLFSLQQDNSNSHQHPPALGWHKPSSSPLCSTRFLPHLRLLFNARSSQADLMLVHFVTPVQVKEGSWGTAKYGRKRCILQDMRNPFSSGRLLGCWKFSPASYPWFLFIVLMTKAASLVEMPLDTLSVAGRHLWHSSSGDSPCLTCYSRVGQATKSSHRVRVCLTAWWIIYFHIPGLPEGKKKKKKAAVYATGTLLT